MRTFIQPAPHLLALVLGLASLGLWAQDQAPPPARKAYRLSQTLALPSDRPLDLMNLTFSPDGENLVAWGEPGYSHVGPDRTYGTLAWKLGQDRLLWERLPAPVQPFARARKFWGCGGGPEVHATWDPSEQAIQAPWETVNLITGEGTPRAASPEWQDGLWMKTPDAALFCKEEGRIEVVTQPSNELRDAWAPPDRLPPRGGDSRDFLGYLNLGMSPDGHRVVGAWCSQVLVREDAAQDAGDPSWQASRPFRLMMFETGQSLPRLDIPMVGNPWGPLWMAPSGSFLLRTEGKALELWNLDVGLRIAHIPAFGETAWDAVWSRDELRVLVRMAKEIAAIEVGTGRIAWVADFPERAFALAPDGSRAAGLHENPQSREVDAIQVWTLEDAPCP